MKVKFCLFLVLAQILCCLNAEPVSIHVDSWEDRDILEQFFKMGVSEEGYSCVLDGIKPISSRDFYSLDQFPVSKDLKHAESELTNTFLVRKAIPIWNRLCAHQKNFVLKAVQLNTSEPITTGWEVQFINISKLRETIDKNIDLFRYILGPTMNTEKLVTKIAYTDERLFDTLQNDLVLVGIVLGFGSYNSLVGGRVETIVDLSISKDCAPFSPKSHLMQNKEKQSAHFMPPQAYGGYYLEFVGGEDLSFFRRDALLLLPKPGFSNIDEELLALDDLREPIPPTLSERLGFVFSAYKGGPSNQLFFESLQLGQKQAKTLLDKSDFLEQVLEKIGGDKPFITCDKPAQAQSLFFSHPLVEEWEVILSSVAKRFNQKDERGAFMDAFRHPSKTSRIAPKMIGVSKANLEGLKKAQHNLAAANAQFETLQKNPSLQVIVPKRLYFQVTHPGSEKELKEADRVRLGYVIEDLEGNILFANYDSWLRLSQTIPGFSHGVKGMNVGEKRTLFIHPTLAYGALTTLPSCTGLIIKVHLLDVDDKTLSSLPSLTPLDLSWIQDPAYYRVLEESIRQKPYFVGSFYHDLLDRIEGLDQDSLISKLDKQETGDIHK